MTIFMMLCHYAHANYNMGRDRLFQWKVLGLTFIAALPPLLTAIIMGGMTFAWFTPTEAAIAAVPGP
jgi:TRAP-type C4-dicarboxylate transport system permease large subunit